jgi:hypothetical protein
MSEVRVIQEEGESFYEHDNGHLISLKGREFLE